MAERFDDSNKSALSYILAALLFIGGLLLLVVVINLRSSADDTSSSASINNATPVINSVTFSETSQGPSISAFTPNENTTKSIYVYGSYTDNNGCADVTSLSMQLYQTLSASSGCSYNDNRCYNSNSTGYSCNFTTVPGDACSGGTDTTANYECTVPIQYFAEATDTGPLLSGYWVGAVSATDASAANGSNSANFEMNTLTALDVGSSINYGSLGLGDTSADTPVTITNTGNKDPLDVQVSGTSMGCTVGTIPTSSQKYALASGVAYGSMISLTGSAVSSGALVSKATAAASPSTYNIYWKLLVPSSGLSGSCAGTTTFSGN